MAHGGADGVHRTAVEGAGVGLRQVVHDQFGLPLLVFDFIAVRLCSSENLLLRQKSVQRVRGHKVFECNFSSDGGPLYWVCSWGFGVNKN